MPIPIQSVIFDYGKVLCQPQQHEDIAAMASILKTTVPAFEPLYWACRMLYDAAQFDAETYWMRIADGAKAQLTDTEIQALRRLDVESWARPCEIMPDWAQRLHNEGVRTAVLSNMPTDLRNWVTGPGTWLPQFDHLTFSCDVRVCKPEPKIYELCLEGLQSEPKHTLFLDDRPENIEAAERAGIHALLFTTPLEAAAALKERFSLPVPLEC